MDALVCETCWALIFNTEAIQNFWTRESDNFCYTTTWTQIVASAETGCSWCAFLISALPSPDSHEWPGSWAPTTDLSVVLEEACVMDNASPPGFNHCQIDFGSEGSARDWHVELDLFVDKIDEPAMPVTARSLQTELNSPEAYSQIGRWLDQCKEHKDCGAISSTTSLPSRLIEVAPADTLGNPCLQSTESLQGPYLALSYCWGSKQSYVLTTKNIDMLRKKLDVDLLPQTILDAIEVTKTLGFKYLWVDALCIMQDSTEPAAREDMNRELAKMDQVYKNAIMTIVAACAPSATDGFLKRRPPGPRRHFDIPCRLDAGRFFVPHIYEHKMYDDISEPINARAWTFQEQLLSTRLLIYASHTLQWQCRTMTCNNGGSYHSPNPSAAPRLPSPAMLLSKGTGGESERGQHDLVIPHFILQHWLSIIAAFSRRNISFPGDKLPAFSALAASYYPIFGPDYRAGIWVKSSVQQLCWCSPSRTLFFTRPTHYRAPSWSWAALDGPIHFPSFLTTDNINSVCIPCTYFKIFEWQTTLKAANVPYGEVTAGSLVVTTVLRDGIFDPSTSPTTVSIEVGATKEDDPRPKMQTARAYVDVAEDSFRRQVRCLAMYRNSIKKAGSLENCGLMLAKSRAYSDDSFQRIGVYYAEDTLFDGYPLQTVRIV